MVVKVDRPLCSGVSQFLLIIIVHCHDDGKVDRPLCNGVSQFLDDIVHWHE